MKDEIVKFDNDESSASSGAVTLSIPKRHFGEFIQGLLGEPRRLSREYDFPFKIDFDWLAHLDSIVMQRVMQQHRARLIDFEAKVYMSNMTRKTLPSREALLTFGDNSFSPSVGITLSWVFLIEFPHSNAPEKQAIRIAAFSDEFMDYKRQLYYSRAERPRSSQMSKLNLGIEHTEVTWGEDIFNHIDNQMRALEMEPTIIAKIANRTHRCIQSGYTAFLYFLAVGLFLYFDWKRVLTSRAEEFRRQFSKISSDQEGTSAINQKIDFFVSALLVEDVPFLFVAALKLTFFVLLFAGMGRLADSLRKLGYPGSFVLLNERAKNLFNDNARRRELWTLGILLAFSINVLATLAVDPIAPWMLKLFDAVVLKLF